MNTTTPKRFLKSFALASFFLLASGPGAHAQTWTASGSTPNTSYPGRWSPVCFAIGNTAGSKLYFGGGYVHNSTNALDFWEYNTANGQWTRKKDIPSPDRTGGVFFSINGKGYVGLGAQDFNSLSGSPVLLKDLHEYDPATDKWTKKADLPDSARYECGVFVVNGKAYVVGGTTGKWTMSGGYVASNDVWEYNPALDKWTAKKAFPASAITHMMSFAIGSKGYLTCGEILNGSSFTSSRKTWEYDPAADKWTAKGDFPGAARSGGVAFAMGNTGYAGLGKTGFSTFYKDLYRYNPGLGSWNAAPIEYPAAGRAFAGAAAIGNTAYIGAGWSLSGSSQQYYKEFYKLSVPGTAIGEAQARRESLECYPNPCRDRLFVRIPGGGEASFNWTMYNMAGQAALSGTTVKGGAIELGALPAGRYVLQVIGDDGPVSAMIDIVGSR